MLYLFGLLLFLFVFVSIIPFIQSFVSRFNGEEEMQYTFPQELLNSDMDNLKYEQVDGRGVLRRSLQDRGSVRLAKGNILGNDTFESRKVEAYSVELP